MYKISWSRRIWARYYCSTNGGNFTCLSGDCDSGKVTCDSKGAIPPATLVEFTLAGYGRKDFYDISLVDGFNIPVSVKPLNRCDCSTTSWCPNELAGGGVIGCKSACVAFQQPQYCCTGPYGSPKTCKPTRYSLLFKHLCPQAYSYAYDDQTNTFTCTKANYMITFCPGVYYILLFPFKREWRINTFTCTKGYIYASDDQTDTFTCTKGNCWVNIMWLNFVG